ncbi:MAG: tryptophan halogenase family protein [Pseudomonadota bacterium]
MSTHEHPDTIRNVVIVGGGTAGWMAAAAIGKLLGQRGINIRLIESDAIGTVGVGEATIPQITLFNRLLGIDEDAFMRETQATFKLGIEFVNWTRLGQSYFHPFGNYGADMDGVHFHHFWLHQQQQGATQPLGDYCLQEIAARESRFTRPDKQQRNSPLGHIAYAFQFDAGLYAQYLRRFSEQNGVERIEGDIVDVTQRNADGFVESVTLRDGTVIGGDLFIDCSGFRGLLIEQTLKTGYDDWSQWLPCNRAVAVPCEAGDGLPPFTRSTAHTAGWQWRIPLQHRIGNGHVYCDGYMDSDEATTLLLDNLDGAPTREPIHLRFTTGMRKRSWHRNVVALGLSAGFMEPLESTSIHLIQTGIARLMTLFPTRDFAQADIDEYNRATRQEYEYIRDFLVLHYRQTERDDSAFWRHCQNLPLSDNLTRKLALYRANGRIVRDKDELFTETSWLAVMHGQGVTAQGHHPVVTSLGNAEVSARLQQLHDIVAASAKTLPTHRAYIEAHCAAHQESSG